MPTDHPSTIHLITSYKRYNPIARDNVSEFEAGVLRDPLVSKIDSDSLALDFLRRVCGRLYRSRFRNVGRFAFGAVGWIPSGHHYFAMLREVEFSKCFPFFALCGRKSVYLDDAWPHTHDAILNFVSRFRVENVFVHSPQVVEMLRKRDPRIRSFWIPEGIDPQKYRHAPYDSKDIDVLNFGRRFDRYHERILEPLQRMKKKYLFEKNQGEVVFYESADFIDGLARTKISICVPLIETNAKRAGGISTMTMRYLQSMAAKCLVVGMLPADMLKVFSYNPIVEIDWSDPPGQLLKLLANFSDYIPLIERNYATVLASHTCEKRWYEIAKILRADVVPEESIHPQ